MIAAAGWLALLCGVAAAGWLIAAYGLRATVVWRCAATAGAPFLALAGPIMIWAMPPSDPGWQVVIAMFAVIAGAIATLPALGIWLLMEARLGDRVR